MSIDAVLTTTEALTFIPWLHGPRVQAESSPMFLHRLLSWIRREGRGSTLPQDEPGVVISTRLKELLPVESAKTVETPFTDPPSEDDENRVNREKFGT